MARLATPLTTALLVPALALSAPVAPSAAGAAARAGRAHRLGLARHVAWAGSFEGRTSVGLGVRARLPFRVLLLDGSGDRSRLVVDVAHRW